MYRFDTHERRHATSEVHIKFMPPDRAVSRPRRKSLLPRHLQKIPRFYLTSPRSHCTIQKSGRQPVDADWPQASNTSRPTTMKRPNNRDLTISGLKACGFKQDFSRSVTTTHKYQVFVVLDSCGSRCFLVGRSGALRLKRPGLPVSKSLSLTNGRVHAALRSIGQYAITGNIESVQQALRIFDELTMRTVAI